jgi:hypothetical protein
MKKRKISKQQTRCHFKLRKSGRTHKNSLMTLDLNHGWIFDALDLLRVSSDVDFAKTCTKMTVLTNRVILFTPDARDGHL